MADPLDNAGTGDNCIEPQVQLTFMPWPNPAGTWGTAPQPGGNWVSQQGASYDPGMPFGKYTICLVDTAPSPDKYMKFAYDNTRANGAATTVKSESTGASWSGTSCVG